MLEKDWSEFLDYCARFLGLFLFYVLGHLPVLEEEGVEYEFGFEVASKHQFTLNLLILNILDSTSIL